MSTEKPVSATPSGRSDAGTGPVGLAWLVTVRWTTVLAGIGAAVAGRGAAQLSAPVTVVALTIAAWAASNVWLTWTVRHERAPVTLAASLVLLDVALLTGVLYSAGGILNPASVFYLVQIVMAALVLGRAWTWGVTAAAVAGYASLYLVPPRELGAALSMHREIGIHMRGMWIAFAITALLIAALVTRLAMAIERRDRALNALREKTARAGRAASLATLAAGAAHELSTPLATIAVAARELERRLADDGQVGELVSDAHLIRTETDRCRRVLEAMAGQSGELVGESPRATTAAAVVAAVAERLTPAERARLDVTGTLDQPLVWPARVVARAIVNLVQNGLQASSTPARVALDVAAANGVVQVSVTDHGAGMSPDDLARAGDPFFTTKAVGQGSGLGLFVARSTFEQLGGQLQIHSARGAGTRIVCTLPSSVVAESIDHA